MYACACVKYEQIGNNYYRAQNFKHAELYITVAQIQNSAFVLWISVTLIASNLYVEYIFFCVT